MSDGDIDFQSLKTNLDCWHQAGVRGYVALGSTGERVHLDEREYLSVIEAARAEIPGESIFIAGAGQQSTQKTIAEIKLAARAGVDAVLVLTPYYYRPAITQEVLGNYYRAVAEGSPVPVILYSMPALTGINIDPPTVAQLSTHENIIGLKDSSGNLEGLKNTLSLVNRDFAVLTGNATILFDALVAGARGGILAVGCLVPEVCLEILKAVKAGDHKRAELLQSRLTPLAVAVTTRYGIGGLKAAMDLNGYKGGSVRAPLSSPANGVREELAQLLNEMEKIL